MKKSEILAFENQEHRKSCKSVVRRRLRDYYNECRRFHSNGYGPEKMDDMAATMAHLARNATSRRKYRKYMKRLMVLRGGYLFWTLD